MNICTTCRRQVKPGQRVIRNYILTETTEGEHFDARLTDVDYQHANCYDADGPRYDDDGIEIMEMTKGYVKGRN